MTFITYPNFSGGGGDSGGGGGGGPVTYPLNGPAGSASAPTFSVGGMGGLFSPSGGGVGLASNGIAGLTLDASGNVLLPKQITVVGGASFSAITASGALSAASLGITGSASISQGLSAATLAASGGITGQSLNVQAGISGATLTLSGDAHVGNIFSTGTFSAASIASTGPVYFPISTADAPGIAGNDDSRNTGIYVDTNSGLGFAAGGNSVAFVDAGGIFHIPGSLETENATIGTQLIAGSLSVTNTLNAAGPVSISNTLRATQAVTFDGDLTVSGQTTLANFSVDTINIQNNFSVGGQSSFTGSVNFASAVTANQGLTVAGQTTLADVSAALGNFTSFQIEGTADLGFGPVLTAGQRRFTATLGNNGDLALSGRLQAGNSVIFSKDLTVGSLASNADITAAGVISGAGLSGQYLSLPNKKISSGQGIPYWTMRGSQCDEYTDTAAGALFLKVSGSASNTGWAQISTAASGVSYPALAPDSAASAPSYSFAQATNYGLGHASSGLYLATSGVAAATIDSAQNVVLSAGLTVEGTTSLQGLSAAGATSLQKLTALNTSLQALTATTGSFSSALTVGGLTSLASATLTGSLSAAGNVTGAVLFTGSTPFQAGSGSPQGRVAAPVGALYTDTAGGGAWYKMAGTDTSGWTLFESGAPPAVAPAYPLAAPQGSTPQYAFQNGATDGLGSVSTGTLYLATGGNTAISIDSSQAVSLAASLSVAGGLSVASTLTVAGLSSLAAASLSGTLSVQGLATFSGGVSIPATLSVGQTISAGVSVRSNGATWTSGSGAPTASANDGDFYTDTKAGDAASLYVRTNGAWKAVALAGAPAPGQFPLRAPADSASAPSYSWAAGTGTYGLYSPGNNQVAISTSSAVALSIDASQNVTLAGALLGQAATFSQITSNGALTVAQNASIGGTLSATGAVTFSSTLASGSIQSSGAISGTNGSFNGSLSSSSLSVTNDASVGGNLTVSGTASFTGIQRAPYYQAGNGSVTSPSYAFTSESGLGFYRSAAGAIAFAAAGSAFATLNASSAVFAGTGSFAGSLTAALLDTPIVRNSGGALSLQAGTTTTLTLAAGSTSSTVPVVVPAGSTSAPGLVVGAAGGLSSANDARPSFPVSVSLTNPRGAAISLTTVPDTNTASNYFILGAAGGGIVTGAFAPNGYANGLPGNIYQYTGGGSGTSLYVYEGTSSGNAGWVGVRTTSQPVIPSYPLVGPAGTASAPTFAAGSANTGLFSGTDALSRVFAGITQGGVAVARFASFTSNSLPVYIMGLGDPTSATVSGGIVASAQLPSTGAPNAYPGMLYQFLGGGATQSLWVNESTTSTPAFAKVLTSSSSVSASFPLLAPSDTATAPSYSWAAETGLGFYRSAAATLVAVAAGNPLATFTTNLVTLPGALRVGGTNAGLTSPGANQLALQTAGNTAVTVAATGIATFGFQASFTSGTAASPGVAVGGVTSGLSLVNDAAGNSNLAISQAGQIVGRFKALSVNSTATYQLSLGDPTSTTVNGGIIASAQTPTGNVTGFGGQIFQYLNGGTGSSLWVYEGTTSGTSGWAKVLTSSTTLTPTYPLLAPSGSAAAPSYSFSGATSSGLYLGDIPYMSQGGKQAMGWTSNIAGAGYNGFTLGAANTPGVPYMFAVPSGAANAGNPSTNGINAFQAALMLNASGAAGNQIWIKEVSGGTGGWTRILSETTPLNFSRLLQTTAPAAVSGQTLAYADSVGRINFVTSASSAASIQPYLQPSIAAVQFGASQTMQLAFNGITAVALGATLFTLSLPATTTYDLVYNFQIEGTGGFKIQAPSGVIIYNGTSASTSGGSLTSNAIGSFITLYNRAGSSLWVARGTTGTWTAA